MARQLRWSPEAVEDVEAIAQYIERDSNYYAKAVVSQIVSLAESIPDQPELGSEKFGVRIKCQSKLEAHSGT